MKRLNFKTQGNVIKIFLFSLLVTACSYGDDISTLTKRVKNLEDAVSNFRAAYYDGKMISSVNVISEGSGGYVIAFSDGTSLNLVHSNDANGGVGGKDGAEGNEVVDGVTPMIKIDEDGYWCVSYDDGMTYSRILDASGNPISAIRSIRSTGDKEDQGEKGDSGICVKVVIVDGLYVFQLYSPDDPNTIIESIKTPYTSNPAHVLQSIVEDQENGVITLTMADGTAFKFNLDVSYPSSIVLLTDHISVSGQEHTASFEFRINPSNSYINFVFDGSNPNIELDQISITRAGDADSYVTKPSNYKIIDVSPSFNESSERKVGQYTVKVSSESQDADGEEIVALVITTKDGRGNKIQISSTLMTVEYDTRHPQIYGISVAGIDAVKTDNDTFYVKLPYGTNTNSIQAEFSTNSAISVGDVSDPETLDLSNPLKLTATLNGVSREYTLIVYYSNLPVIYVNTPSPIVSKDDWVKKCSMQIVNAGDDNAIYEKVQIKGRGNSTWGQPKKPYAIKLDQGAEVLGMPSHKRWCLLADYFDPSLVRNNLAYWIGREISTLDWSPRTQEVELVINGKFNGTYLLCEQIKIDENRVNVGDDGFIMEIDARASSDTDPYFSVSNIAQPVAVKDYDEEDGSIDYIKDFINRADALLFSANYLDPETGWKSMIDMDSFVEWYLIKEITKDNDAIFWSSCYMNLKRGEKLKMGPLWDFDISMGNYFEEGGTPNANNPEGFYIQNVRWYQRMFTDPDFVALVKQRFEVYYNSKDKIFEQIDKIETKTHDSYAGEIDLWRSSYSSSLYDYRKARIDYLKQWLTQRFDWLKSEFDKMNNNS